ncbi:hypothetical protein [Yersinia intermedia]|uniref:hypothetical protein n=1 Tax=Yersinia intermedia TaxID=631 RepID=UPI001CFCFA35|nr:hypothetical protein [Yersinia intermedia]MCB5312111.1 hypothetical protein [Yersinia intermedia]MCB5326143.1 hypothetical protein [Yersinia intermedia]
MSKFIAVSHRPEIAVKYDPDQQSVVISIDECPTVTDPELGIYQEIEMHPGDIPKLIDALSKAYEHVTGEKP